jgi:hypothetical protein
VLKQDDMPGDKISMDHYQSSIRRRLEYTWGNEKDIEQYVGGTILVDHASGLILTHHQPTLGSGDALQLLGKMEQFFSDHNVPVQNFHTDSGIFTCSAFRKQLSDHDIKMVWLNVLSKQSRGRHEQ